MAKKDKGGQTSNREDNSIIFFLNSKGKAIITISEDSSKKNEEKEERRKEIALKRFLLHYSRIRSFFMDITPYPMNDIDQPSSNLYAEGQMLLMCSTQVSNQLSQGKEDSPVQVDCATENSQHSLIYTLPRINTVTESNLDSILVRGEISHARKKNHDISLKIRHLMKKEARKKQGKFS